MSQRQVRWTDIVVADAADVADGIRRIDLDFPRPVHGAPGSHIDVLVHVEGRTERRSYSVVRVAPERCRVVVAVRLAVEGGGGSRYMHSLVPGDRLRATEPLQDFPLTLGRPGYVLVAGGIGITPLLPMYRALCDDKAQVRLVYAGRSRAAMAFLDELGDGDAELVVDAESGVLDADAVVAGISDDHDLYVCGPGPMMEALRAAWRRAGRAPSQLRFETFGSGGAFAAEEFVVEVPRLALTTVVPANRSLLDTLRSAGADMMFECRRGECGLCEVKVLAHDGVIDHRDVFLSPEQHVKGGYLCTCVSRVARASSADGPPRLVLDIP